MKTNSISNISLIILSALAVVGCNKKVDFRNIEISNNLIYERGENKEFTGKITNMPLSNMPVKNISKITGLINNVSSNKSLGEILAVNSLEAMTGNGYGRIVCDTVSDGGVLDGATTCKIPRVGTPLFSFTFKKNSLDGKVTIYDTKHDGSIVAEAEYKDGNINGPSKIFSYRDGKLIHSVSWRNGVMDGLEERRDESTNNLVFSAKIEDGQYNGEMKKYRPDGEFLETSIWVRGKREEATPLVPAITKDQTDCVDSWINSFRKSEGAEAMIIQDQIDEWEQSCKSGKSPG